MTIELEPGFFTRLLSSCCFLFLSKLISGPHLCCVVENKIYYHVTSRFFEDCAIRLMDVNKDVRDSYQQLIKALPTDLLTRFVSMFILGLWHELNVFYS